MILDKIGNINNYVGISKNMDLAIDYISKNDLRSLSAGKYEISGNDVYILIQEYETKLIEDSILESHRKYVDIQYVLDGEELIGYAPIDELSVSKDYDDENDYMLHEGKFETHKISGGKFAAYFPNDGHKPTINPVKNNVKKAVVKVKL